MLVYVVAHISSSQHCRYHVRCVHVLLYALQQLTLWIRVLILKLLELFVFVRLFRLLTSLRSTLHCLVGQHILL